MDSMRLHAVVAMLATACVPTFAPPPFTAHGGAPGRLVGGEVELRGTATGFGAEVPSTGGPALSYALDDRWALEAGAEYSRAGWALGRGGARATGERQPGRWLRLVADGEVGGALGAGGNRCTGSAPLECDGIPWHRRVAGGGYVGVGGGLRFPWLALFVRGRVQLAGAHNVPRTSWASAAGGLEFPLGRHVALWSAGGWGGYDNRVESLYWWFYEVGLSVRWATRRW